MAQVLAVEPGQEVELRPLVLVGHVSGSLEVEDRAALRAEQRPLVGRGQEPRTPVQRPALDALRVAEHDEPGQVLILAPQAVGDPGARGRKPRPGRPPCSSGKARAHGRSTP